MNDFDANALDDVGADDDFLEQPDEPYDVPENDTPLRLR